MLEGYVPTTLDGKPWAKDLPDNYDRVLVATKEKVKLYVFWRGGGDWGDWSDMLVVNCLDHQVSKPERVELLDSFAETMFCGGEMAHHGPKEFRSTFSRGAAFLRRMVLDVTVGTPSGKLDELPVILCKMYDGQGKLRGKALLALEAPEPDWGGFTLHAFETLGGRFSCELMELIEEWITKIVSLNKLGIWATNIRSGTELEELERVGFAVCELEEMRKEIHLDEDGWYKGLKKVKKSSRRRRDDFDEDDDEDGLDAGLDAGFWNEQRPRRWQFGHDGGYN